MKTLKSILMLVLALCGLLPMPRKTYEEGGEMKQLETRNSKLETPASKPFSVKQAVAITVIFTFCVASLLGYAYGRQTRYIEDIEKGREIAYSQIREILKANIGKVRMFYIGDLGIKFYPMGYNTAQMKFLPADDELPHPALTLAGEAAQ